MNIALAVVLALLAPGAGQAYNGQRAKAVVWAVIAVLVPIFAALALRYDSQWAAITVTFAYPIVVLMGLLDAAGEAVRIRRAKNPQWAPDWPFAVGVFVMSWAVAIGMKLENLPAKIAGADALARVEALRAAKQRAPPPGSD